MKRKKLLKKLQLNKNTISHLNPQQMKTANGGAYPTDIGKSCQTEACCDTKHNCTEI